MTAARLTEEQCGKDTGNCWSTRRFHQVNLHHHISRQQRNCFRVGNVQNTLYASCEFTTHGTLFYIWYYMWHLPLLVWNIWRAYVITTSCEFITKDPESTCERLFHVWIEFLSKCDVMQCVSSYNNTLEKIWQWFTYMLRCCACLHSSVRSVRTKVKVNEILPVSNFD